MALLVSAFDVIVRASALPRGLAAFAARVPNATFCTDGRIARASFMAQIDRGTFASRLGLPAEAMAFVEKHALAPGAEWLQCGRYAGVDAVWLRGESPEPLVVPVTWSPGELVYSTPEEVAENLEYLGEENGLKVYRDHRTGRRLYSGSPARPRLSRDASKRLEAQAGEARGLLAPFLTGDGPLGFFERRRVKRGVVLLEQVAAEAPDAWNILWMLGMGLRRLGEEEAALHPLQRAYALNPSHRDVGREYAGQCFRLGLCEEGLSMSRVLHARFPDDVGLHANLALALLLAGRLDDAQQTANAALARDPADPITRHLTARIEQVRAGRIPRPTRLSDL